MNTRQREIRNIKDAIKYFDAKIKSHRQEYGEYGHYRNELIKLRKQKKHVRSLLKQM